MARTMFYHRTEFPLGKIFDTETNKPDPYVDTAPWGTVDHPDKLSLSQDDLIEVMVKKELATHNTERSELEREFQKKTGTTDAIHFAAKEKTLVKTLDEPLAKKGAKR